MCIQAMNMILMSAFPHWLLHFCFSGYFSTVSDVRRIHTCFYALNIKHVQNTQTESVQKNNNNNDDNININ